MTIGAALGGTGTVSGKVLDPSGQPVANVPVYLELGLEGPIDSARTDAQGRFAFSEVGAGTAGVFTLAPGYAYGGETVTVALGSEIKNLAIQLQPEATLGGRVVDFKGKPVAGATVTRVALLGNQKVGIPLARLQARGFEAPVSDKDGRFTLAHMPEHGQVALKVSHPDYAQSGVEGIEVGQKPAEITMYKGILIHGQVLTRGTDSNVSDALILFSNAQPPNNTSFARTDSHGAFTIRLNPGVYLYKAEGAQYRSPAWERLIIRGDKPRLKVTLHVSKLGRISGAVRDAKTEAPIAGAKIALVSGGHTAGIFKTGPTGAFNVQAAAGKADVFIEAAPGYRLPDHSGVRVEVKEGETFQVPTFWLAPLAPYHVQIVTQDGKPAPGAAVRLLRPEQVGWYVAGDDGGVDINVQSIPDKGRIIALAEDPAHPRGALFALDKDNTSGATVQLLPLSALSGAVVSDHGKELDGAAVGIFYVGEKKTGPLLVWRVLSDNKGAFHWSGAIPKVPLRCIAYAAANKRSKEDKTPSGESATFMIDEGGTKDVGNIVVPDGKKAKTLLGKKLAWTDNPVQAGKLPNKELLQSPATVVLYCSQTDAPVVVESMQRLHEILAKEPVQLVVVVDGAYTATNTTIPVLKGQAPSNATTYYLDGDNRVVLESFGIPSFDAIRRLVHGGSTP